MATADWEVQGGPPIHVFSYDSDEVEEYTPATMREAHAFVGQRRVTWINVDAAGDPGVLASLERDFGIHPLTVEDVKNTHQRPKFEEYPNYMYVATQMLTRDADGELETEQISILVGEGWVVTVQEHPGDMFDGVRARIRQLRPRMRAAGPDYLVYALLDAIVDAYFPILEKFGLDAEELEDGILEGTATNTRDKLQHMRRQLLTLRRVAWPQRDAVAAMERTEHRWIMPETRTFLRDVSDHATRVLDFVETTRELAASLMDLHLASVAQKTNDVMKVLTIVATIFIPLTFVAGVYGMNFDNMPELHTQYGYFVTMGIMVVLGLLMFAMFRRRGWV